MDYERATRAEQFKARACDAAGEVYATPNYGANAAMGSVSACNNQPSPRPTQPSVSSIADMTNDLHSALTALEEDVNHVHQRIGADHYPVAGRSPDKLTDGNGPLDFTAEQLYYAILRINNLRTYIGAISARI